MGSIGLPVDGDRPVFGRICPTPATVPELGLSFVIPSSRKHVLREVRHENGHLGSEDNNVPAVGSRTAPPEPEGEGHPDRGVQNMQGDGRRRAGAIPASAATAGVGCE